MKRSVFLCLLLGLLTVLLMACNDQGTTSNTNSPTTATAVTSTPTPAPTFSPKAVQSLPTAVSYYQALKIKDYDTAYTYLDPNAKTQDGQPLTKDTFIKLARAATDNYGPISNISMLPESNDGTQIVTTIDRNEGMHYHSHLTLKKEDDHWKIVSFDRI